ncbi:MAG: type III pantothenate kinase [Chlorobi bacterium]|nr:type III pantothenate kinase [Chlorobiota bacterium]
MNLVIDVGNTNVKLAVFQDFVIIGKRIGKLESLEKDVAVLVKEFKDLKKAIISSVGRLKEKDIQIISKQIEVYTLNKNSKLPFKSKYKTPETLGVDRIALVSASTKFYPNQNVLIIDAGTCITYDFITSENVYLGGAISPGIRLRYQSLNNLTENLPLLEKKAPKNLIGNSSKESIHSGVINGILMEIDGAIQEYNKKYKDLTVILTGGDTDFLSKRLKSSIFANSNFLLEGLNFILKLNSNK